MTHDPQLQHLESMSMEMDDDPVSDPSSLPQSSPPDDASSPHQRQPSVLKRYGVWIGLGIGLVIGLGVGSGQFSPSPPAAVAEPEQTESNAPARSVTVATAEVATVERTLDATGTVAPYDLLPIAPRTSGLQVRQVLVDEGDSVAAGEVLAVLDDSVLQTQIVEAEARLIADFATVEQRRAALSQAEANLAEAEANLTRYQSLYSEGVISQQDLDSRSTTAVTSRESVRVAEADILSAEADVRSQEALIAQLQTQLEQTLVVAPANGIVAERMARVGDVSSASNPLFTVIRDRRLELQVTLPETQLPQVPVGAPVQITSDADTRIQLRGQVREISPLVNPDTREATIRIDLPGSDLLRSGMFLRASLVTATTQGIIVPAQAVLPQPDGSTVVYRLVEGDRVAKQPVEVGEILDSANPDTARMEILSGLNPGDRIVVTGASYLNDGDRIAVSGE